MDISLPEHTTQILFCLVLAAFVLGQFKRFLNRDKHADLKNHIQTAFQEHKKDLAARNHMFGTSKATLIANIVTTCVFGLIVVSLAFPPLKAVLFPHLLIGYFVSSKAAKQSRGSDYERLQLSERIWYRLYYASIWPIILLRGLH